MSKPEPIACARTLGRPENKRIAIALPRQENMNRITSLPRTFCEDIHVQCSRPTARENPEAIAVRVVLSTTCGKPQSSSTSSTSPDLSVATIDDIDDKVRRILRLGAQLGWLDRSA